MIHSLRISPELLSGLLQSSQEIEPVARGTFGELLRRSQGDRYDRPEEKDAVCTKESREDDSQ